MRQGMQSGTTPQELAKNPMVTDFVQKWKADD